MADGSAIVSRGQSVRPILLADLFCGAGGSSSGAIRAVQKMGRESALIAVNHWQIAIDTHTLNHPLARHHCTDLEHAKPRELVPEGRLDLLIASPTCTFHSRARGGRPIHDQQRMDPWHVVRWCTDLRVARLMIENVPEFVDWGPCSLVTGRPIPSRKGEYFRAWCDALKAIGYRIDWRVLCCADYGDPTTRMRFFLIARADRGKLAWPEPTHARGGASDLLGSRKRWRAANEIIDWTIPGKSIFTRKRPLKPNTLRRILAGAQRYGWPQVYINALQALLDGRTPRLDVSAEEAAPFLLHLRGTHAHAIASSAISTDEPIPTLTAGGGHVGLVMALGAGGVARALDQPVPTITAGGGAHMIEPLIAPYYGGGSGLTSKPASEPLDAVTTKARFGIAEPLIVSTSNSSSPGTPREASDPLRTITTAKGGDMAVASPIIMRGNVGEGRERDMRTADEPLPTITCSESLALAAPLFEPCDFRIDILYRMLHWRELARAMSFDIEGVEYQFAGNATEITKQIGNAVPGRTAEALVRTLFGEP